MPTEPDKYNPNLFLNAYASTLLRCCLLMGDKPIRKTTPCTAIAYALRNLRHYRSGFL